jgi:tripartite-type tricarboxylate transporter receptor subunit TctC
MDEYRTPDATRRLANLMLASGEFGRPIIASPGIPEVRVRLLRDAFAKTMRDPDFLAEARKKNLEIDPISGEDLETLAKDVVSAGRDVIERMSKLLSK